MKMITLVATEALGSGRRLVRLHDEFLALELNHLVSISFFLDLWFGIG